MRKSLFASSPSTPAPPIATAPLGAFALELGEQDFDFLRHVVTQNAGIVLGPSKRQLVQGRLARRLRELGLKTFSQYCEHVRDSGPEELVSLINAITTNVTSFFRESHHFEQLAKRMLPEAMTRNAQSRRIRIWSAGCSSGEEPYSIAMSVAESMPPGQRWDLKILATDIDSEMVSTAASGVYTEDRINGVSPERQLRWMQHGAGENSGMLKMKSELISLITFRTLNLLGEWPVSGPFDVIFCRNVMIYFDQPTREKILMRFARLLAPGGYLCIGHSESIHGTNMPYRLVGRTIYSRTQDPVNGGSSVGG
jgi:chemotaxis protein methyltransferase CheR